MSAFGTKRTWASAPHMSAFGGKADIALVGPERSDYLTYKLMAKLSGNR